MLFVCILINNSNQKQYSVKRETASCIFCFLPSIHSGEECKNKICFAVGYKRPLRNAISNRRKITFGQRELGRLITCYLSNLTGASKAIQLQSFCFIVTILFSYNTNNDSVTPFGNIKYRQIKGTKRQIKFSNHFLVQK